MRCEIKNENDNNNIQTSVTFNLLQKLYTANIN